MEGVKMEEHRIQLSLGGMDAVGKEEEEKHEKERVGGDEDEMGFEVRKEEDDQDDWGKISMDGDFLLPCSLINQVGGIESEAERKRQDEVEEEEEEEEAEEEVEDVEADDDDDEEEEEDGEEEEEEDYDLGFHSKDNTLEGVGSENLIDVMRGTTQVSFTPLFGNMSGSKRVIEHLESDIPHHSLNGGNKRMRSDGHWDARPYSDFDMFEEDVGRLMVKGRMMMEEKERACQHNNIQQQQVLYNELEQRDRVIRQLQKAKLEECKKSQMEIYRLERVLNMMGNLLEGYRKAIKETEKAFAEYRAKCQVPEVPIYNDSGSGGLVLSTAELEKLRLKEEEEERLNRLFLEKLIKEFEAKCVPKFEGYENDVKLLADKLVVVGEKLNALKETSGKPKVSAVSGCVATEDCIPAEESVPTEEGVPAEESVPTEECVSAEGSVPVIEHAPAEECVPMEVSGCVATENCVPVKESVRVPTEEGVRAEESVPTEECVSADGSVTVIEHAPAEECLPMEECGPTEG